MEGLQEWLADAIEVMDSVGWLQDESVFGALGVVRWLVGDLAYSLILGSLQFGILLGVILMVYKVYVMVNPMK